MKTVEAQLTTTHVDRDGECVTREALHDLVALVNETLIPMGMHHDPRVPPQGRFLTATVEQLDDGELAAKATCEFYENGDTPSLLSDRTLSDRRPEASIELVYDQSYLAPEILRDLDDLSKDSGIPCSQSLKKAAGGTAIPLLALTGIAIGYAALQSFMQGFFQQMGAETWKLLSRKLPALIRAARERNDSAQESLLLVRVVAPENMPYVCVELVVQDASSEEFRKIASEAAPILDDMTARLKEQYEDIVHFVYSYEDGEVRLLYAVRKDAVPLRPDSATDPTELTATIRDALPVDVGMGISISGRAKRGPVREE